MKEKIINFVNDVTKEMKKVTWPTKPELRDSTVIVLAATVIFAIFVYVVDLGVTKLLHLLFA